MIQLIHSSRIRACPPSIKSRLQFQLRFRAIGRPPKQIKPFDFANFDPQADPNEASAIYTNLGWFYIPLRYNTDKQPRILLNKEFTRNGFTKDTDREQIQQFIYQWCASFTPTVYKKKTSFKAESEQKNLDLLFRQQMSQKVHADLETKRTREEQRFKNEANRSNDKLRFKIDPDTKKTEIRGWLKMTNVFNYYIQRQTYEGELKTELEKLAMTPWKIRQIVSKEWNKLSSTEKDAIKQEYLEILSRGKDYHLGKEVDLESRLSDEVSEDGFRFKKSYSKSKTKG
ncbi:unnamed protein product [Candida parapsilosis]